MTFSQKADYAGAFDEHGISLLDYRLPWLSRIAIQSDCHCPVRSRQLQPVRTYWGHAHKANMLRVADWLVASLRRNDAEQYLSGLQRLLTGNRRQLAHLCLASLCGVHEYLLLFYRYLTSGLVAG